MIGSVCIQSGARGYDCHSVRADSPKSAQRSRQLCRYRQLPAAHRVRTV